MAKFILLSLILASCLPAHAQTSFVEDNTIGSKPIVKVEVLSPAGHCDNREITMIAPWADHFEIAKRRCDTNWFNERRYNAEWATEKLKPRVTGIIYKRLDERGTYQVVVKAFRGNRYRVADTVLLKPCTGPDAGK